MQAELALNVAVPLKWLNKLQSHQDQQLEEHHKEVSAVLEIRLQKVQHTLQQLQPFILGGYFMQQRS